MVKNSAEKNKHGLSATSIVDSIKNLSKNSIPPVEKWNPPFCGNLDIRIARDGTWFYLGTPIGRPELVKLFSSILKKEGDLYFLVTPVEKVGITVDDAPFVAVDFNQQTDGHPVGFSNLLQGLALTNGVCRFDEMFARIDDRSGNFIE